MKRRGDRSTAVFAERVLVGVDDAGAIERVVIWIERKPGAVWAVGRSVNAHLRPSREPRRDDYIFEGYELDDALEQANATLDDDVRVSMQDGRSAACEPFGGPVTVDVSGREHALSRELAGQIGVS